MTARFAGVVALSATVAMLSACSGHANAPSAIDVRVTGRAESHSSESCFLNLTARVADGGTMRYCLKTFSGEPGPNAVVHDRGTMTFELPEGTLRAAVRTVQRFEPDGRHARQSLFGTILGGTGRFEGDAGTISGGGIVEEYPPGHIADSALEYRIAPSS